MRAKRLTWKGETTHIEGRIDPGRIGSKGETTRGEGVKRAKRPDAIGVSSPVAPVWVMQKLETKEMSFLKTFSWLQMVLPLEGVLCVYSQQDK